jgi:hypothetical protein
LTFLLRLCTVLRVPKGQNDGWKSFRSERVGDFQARVHDRARRIPLLGTRLVPDRFSVRVGKVETPEDRERRYYWSAELEVVVEDGRARCVAIARTRKGTALTGKLLRELPLESILREALSSLAVERSRLPREQIDPLREHDLPVDAEGRVEVWTPLLGSAGGPAAFEADYAEAARSRGRGVRLTDEILERVASVYRAALKAGAPPTDAVKTAFDIPRSTAGRWVAETRRRGFLGPATPRRAGEKGRKR